MGNAIPSEAIGTSIGVLIFCCVCLLASITLASILWKHEDRLSYVFAIAVVVSISTTASIIQQIDYAIEWRLIAISKYENAQKVAHNVALHIAGAAYPSQTSLFWIQYYCYNVSSMLVMFWCIALFCGTWDFKSLSRYVGNGQAYAATFTKVVAILLPAVPIGIVQLDVIRAHNIVFLVVVNIILMSSLSIGAVILMLTLIKYLQKRREFSSFRSSEIRSGNTNNRQSQSIAQYQERRRRRDEQWLIVRFTIAFLLLGAYQVYTIIFQFASYRTNSTARAASSPNFSVAQTKSDLLFFMPGVTPSLFSWLIFGTTAPFRREYVAAFYKVLAICKRSKSGSRSSSFADFGGVRAGPEYQSDAEVDLIRPEGVWKGSTERMGRENAIVLSDLSGYLEKP